MKLFKVTFLKNTIILLFLIFGFSSVSAQEEELQFNFWDHVRYGGGIGLSFGDGFFSGTLAPSAIYQFNDQFAFGVGLNGTYNSQKDVYNSTILGGSVLGLFNVIQEIQLSAELEQLNIDQNFETSTGFADENFWNTALFLGLGYTAQNVTVGIRYDVLYDETNSIYANAWVPFVRVFF